MPARAVQLAKRTLVSLLRSLGRAYGVPLTVTRDSADSAVTAAYRRNVLKVHPDKGGRVEDAQRLQGAKEAWDTAKRNAAASAPPPEPSAGSGARAAGASSPTSVALAGAAAAEAPCTGEERPGEERTRS